jgi:predicted  nucleic acid-binding Zn-ribbon protein
MINEYKKLKMQIEYLDDEERKNLENWMAYSRQKRLDYVNQLAYIKREIEKKILEEYKKLESSDKLIGAF